MSVLRSLLKSFGIFIGFLAALIGICVIRALFMHQVPVIDYCNPNEKDYVAEESGPLKRFSEALKFKTISYSIHNYEKEALSNYMNFIFKSELI